MSLILNEVKYVENILKTGEVGRKPSSTLLLLAKYYYNEKNLRNKEIEIKLDEFMRKNYPNYNKVYWENSIESYSKKAGKYTLNKIDEIPITKSELEVIESIGDPRLERFLFTMLCYAKAYNIVSDKNNGWINTDLSVIYNTARLRARRSDDRFHMVNQLLKISCNKEIPLITISQKNTNRNVKINFIDFSGEVVLHISDLRELGYEYMMYKGGKFIRCEICGRLMRKKKNKKYCPECLSKNPYYTPIETKIIQCQDCGDDVEVDAKDTKTIRCEECQKEENNRQRRWRYYNSLLSNGRLIECDGIYYSSQISINDMCANNFEFSHVGDVENPCKQFNSVLHFINKKTGEKQICFGKKTDFKL